MTHTTEQTQSDSLEVFNRPDHFLAEMKNLDPQQFVWHPRLEERFTQPDGVEVRIMSDDNEISGKIYTEDLIYPNSPFEYRNVYNQKGDMIFKQIRFYGELLYGIYECRDEKCMLSKSYSRIPSMQPVIPLGQTRTAFLKETGIDLYDTSKIKEINFFADIVPQSYYILMEEPRFTELFVDARTGKIIYRRKILSGDESQASIPGEWEPEKSPAYIKSAEMVKKFMSEGDQIYQVYRKTNTKEPDRFYEVFVLTPTPIPKNVSPHNASSPLVSFLLDHKKEKILYRFETVLPLISIEGRPFVDISTEYKQHLKMLEAQEEKPGLFGRLRKKK